MGQTVLCRRCVRGLGERGSRRGYEGGVRSKGKARCRGKIEELVGEKREAVVCEARGGGV